MIVNGRFIVGMVIGKMLSSSFLFLLSFIILLLLSKRKVRFGWQKYLCCITYKQETLHIWICLFFCPHGSIQDYFAFLLDKGIEKPHNYYTVWQNMKCLRNIVCDYSYTHHLKIDHENPPKRSIIKSWSVDERMYIAIHS